jgi:hypothetical protein
MKPGQLPEGKLGVYDHKQNLRGHVGPLATAATASRFGVHNAKLGKVDGRDAWVGEKPNLNARPGNGVHHKRTVVDSTSRTKRAAQLAQAKGSVGKTLADTSAMGTTQGAPVAQITKGQQS